MLYHRRLKSILCRVPKEIFSIIFELGVDQGGVEFLRSICLTCRSWHGLAITLPNLWRSVCLYHDTSLKKTALWIKRSRSKPLSIAIIVPPIHTYSVDTPPPCTISCTILLLNEFHRWKNVVIDCAHDNEVSMTLRQKWAEAIQGKNALLLESVDLKLSGSRLPIPSTCSYPRLRSLTLDRRACRWAEVFIEKGSATLASLTISNVEESSDSFTMAQLQNGLRHCQYLEELRMDEICWDVGEQQDDTIITLSHLRTLTLTGISGISPFIRLLRLPKLVELIVGDIEGLPSLFIHLAQHTSTIQNLTTGLWDEASAMQSQAALISLLAMQPHLRSLVIHNANINDGMVDRLIVSQDNSIAPQLEKLGVSIGKISDSNLLAMVRSRHNASLMGGPVKRLKRLITSGRDVSDTVIQKLLQCVKRVNVEDLVNEHEEFST